MITKKKDALELFGGVTKLATTLGIGKASVSKWGETIPQLRSFQLQMLIDEQRKNAHTNSLGKKDNVGK